MNDFYIEYNKELKNIENDKKRNMIELENKRRQMSEMLHGEMGNDMKNVLNGKIKVEFTFKEKLNNFINKILKAI